jgi:anaerobic magnesium-protoporphyrin IX monomethyl ester cyclase
MRILIINPPAWNTVVEHPDETGEEFLEADAFGEFPPLGALYVLSHLEAHTTGHEFFFKDCVA